MTRHNSMQVLTIMNPLSCDNAIYEELKVESSPGGFNINENVCYGKVTSTAINKHEGKNHSYSKVIIMALVIVFALLLGTAGACVAFALQMTTLKSEIASLKMTSTSLGHQLNTSIDMLYQQLSQQNASIDSVNHQLNTSIDMVYQQLNHAYNPATSCKDLYDNHYASSGYYWIGEIGSAVRVYCNMSLTCGNLTGGWMRVANIDMTNTSQNCPSGLSLITSPKRVCDIISTGCVSNDFDIHGAQYSHICGRVIGYQFRRPPAFHSYDRGINAEYVTGVSLTHGQNPRQHIWTFAGARDEENNSGQWKCPCINTNINPPPTLPSFVGNDYFCDTALSTYSSVSVLYGNDSLWDGEGCGPTNTCCYDPERKVNPPWFVKTLSSPTSDDIEMRLCKPYSVGETPIEIVELYVQ